MEEKLAGVNSSLLRMALVTAVVMMSLVGASSAAGAPSIDGEGASNVTAHDATLNAQINPNAAAVTYFFEIDTIRSDNFTHPNCPFGPCASITIGPPLPPGLTEPPREELPAAIEDHSVGVDMASIGATLQSETTYFYRVVARQALTYGSPTIYGAEQSFTTLGASAAPDPSVTNPPSHHSKHHHRRHKHHRGHRRSSHHG